MAGILEPDPMPLAAAADTALLQRLAHVLQDMGLPCACQEEVERTIAIFTEFEIRRTRRRLLESARSAPASWPVSCPICRTLNPRCG
ncbi:hypothetical protein V6L77_06865 [Pannonibacter sp. Pt2-lr]